MELLAHVYGPILSQIALQYEAEAESILLLRQALGISARLAHAPLFLSEQLLAILGFYARPPGSGAGAGAGTGLVLPPRETADQLLHRIWGPLWGTAALGVGAAAQALGAQQAADAARARSVGLARFHARQFEAAGGGGGGGSGLISRRRRRADSASAAPAPLRGNPSTWHRGSQPPAPPQRPASAPPSRGRGRGRGGGRGGRGGGGGGSGDAGGSA